MDNDLIRRIDFYLFFDLLEIEYIFGLIMASG